MNNGALFGILGLEIDAGKRWLARTGKHDCYKIRACLEICVERRLELSVILTGNVT